MANFNVQDAAGATKEFKAVSGDGSGGSPFVSEVGLSDVGETVDVGRVNLIGTAAGNGAVRATGATPPTYAVAAGFDDGTNIKIPRTNAAGHVQVVLQASTAAVGKLSANSGVDIGDVDVTSMPVATAVVNGHKTVTTAGTAVSLTPTTSFQHTLTVKALKANTGDIYVGTSTVSSSNGFELDAGEEVTFTIADPSNIYIDSSVNGEGVSFIGS